MSGACTQIFVSYSHADAEWLKRLQVHLKPLERAGTIEWWDDTRILPGMVWRDEIEKALAAAHIGVLLVSADFLASDFIANHELPPLLAAAQDKGLTILSLIVGPSLFEHMPELSRFQAVNDPDRPLMGLPKAEQEAELLKLANRIRGLADPKPTPDSGSKSEDKNHRLHVANSNQVKIDGKVKIELCQRLGSDWQLLADYFEIHVSERTRFDQGWEPQRVWGWLESRNKLAQLAEGLRYIGRSDLAELIDSTPKPYPPPLT